MIRLIRGRVLPVAYLANGSYGLRIADSQFGGTSSPQSFIASQRRSNLEASLRTIQNSTRDPHLIFAYALKECRRIHHLILLTGEQIRFIVTESTDILYVSIQ